MNDENKGELQPVQPSRPTPVEQDDLPAADQMKYLVELRKTDQLHKSLRLSIVCGTVLGCSSLLVYLILKSAAPVWVQVASLLLGSGGPAYLIWQMRLRLKVIIADLGGRSAEIQASVDAKRTSSEINPDGSNPDVD